MKERLSRKVKGTEVKTSNKLYTMCIHLLDGPIAGKYCGQTISRTIQIRGDQTLKDLHRAIFKAFNREDEHLYEFNLGEGPDDRSAIYSLQSDIPELAFDKEDARDVTITIVDSLGLTVGQTFYYLFDFGDNWLHRIDVIAIEELQGKGRYPKIVARKGKSPLQCPNEGEMAELKGVWATGKTAEECHENLQMAIEDWIAFSLRCNLPVPAIINSRSLHCDSHSTKIARSWD